MFRWFFIFFVSLIAINAQADTGKSPQAETKTGIQEKQAPVKELKVSTKEGTLHLADVLAEVKEIAGSIPSHRVIPGLPGKVITLNGKSFEIRFFSFVDTKGTLPKDITFQTFIEKNNLLTVKSIITQPVEGLTFESIYVPTDKLPEGIYVNMGFQVLDERTSKQ